MHRTLIALFFAMMVWLIGVVAIASTPPAPAMQRATASYPRAMPVETNPCAAGACW